jgi:hypothetical protein
VEERIVELATLMVGVALVASATWDVVRHRRAGRWPTTEGTVTSSGSGADDDGYWWPAIRYEFSVEGNRLSSNRIWASGNWTVFPGRWWSGRVTSRFAAGSVVVVRYNPRNPNDACLLTWHWLPFTVKLWLALLFIAA